MWSFRLRAEADRRLGDLDTAQSSLEEQLREKERRRNTEADEQRPEVPVSLDAARIKRTKRNIEEQGWSRV